MHEHEMSINIYAALLFYRNRENIKWQQPVAYLEGGHGAMLPPLARPWKFFTADFI